MVRSFSGLVTAFRTLSILRVPGRDAEKMCDALPWFPLVGFSLGVVIYIFSRGVFLLFEGWIEFASLVAVIVGILLTGGLHIDGLGDLADGIGGGSGRKSILRIMKDPRVGMFGVMATVFHLLVKWVLFSRLLDAGSFIIVIPSYAISRIAMVYLAVSLPYAREEGGTGSPFVKGGERSHLVYALLFTLLLILPISGFLGLVLLVGGLIMSWLLGMWFLGRVGGVTGDMLGACCELVEVWVVFIYLLILEMDS